MRQIKLGTKKIELKDNVEVFYEKTITKFGTSAKIDAPKKYIGKRAYVIVLKN
jgi:putative transposon-encoded protein